LDLRDRKWWEAAEDCIMRNFVVFEDENVDTRVTLMMHQSMYQFPKSNIQIFVVRFQYRTRERFFFFPNCHLETGDYMTLVTIMVLE
jgi:hypothetical protein